MLLGVLPLCHVLRSVVASEWQHNNGCVAEIFGVQVEVE